MKKYIVMLSLVMFFVSPVQADSDRATPEDVYDLVLKAYEVVRALGDEALPAFNKPDGEFVYKDTYVYVLKCPSEMAAHPFAMKELKGEDISKHPQTVPTCSVAENPSGGWVEYMYPKPGEKEPSRKITFAIGVEGTPYQVAAGIYNETDTVADLNKTLR